MEGLREGGHDFCLKNTPGEKLLRDEEKRGLGNGEEEEGEEEERAEKREVARNA